MRKQRASRTAEGASGEMSRRAEDLGKGEYYNIKEVQEITAEGIRNDVGEEM